MKIIYTFMENSQKPNVFYSALDKSEETNFKIMIEYEQKLTVAVL